MAAALEMLQRARAALKPEAARDEPHESTLQLVLDALSVIAQSGDAAQFREAEQLLNDELDVSGLHAQVIQPLLVARATAAARGERWIAACCGRRLAWSYECSGDSVAALEACEEARQEFAALGDREGLARCLNNQSVVWIRRGDPDEALRSLHEAQALVDELGIAIERARVRINLGYAYQLLGQFKAGRRYLEEAYAIAAPLHGTYRAAALLNLTRLEMAEGNAEQASVTLLQADAVIKEGNQFGYIESLLLRGMIASSRGQYQAAIAHLCKGIELAEPAHALLEQKELWEALSQAHAGAGDYQAAFEALSIVSRLDARLRRERAMLQAATLAERRVAQKALSDAEKALASEQALRETLARLEVAKRDLERAAIENSALLAELDRQSREDPLTGLMNRRALDAELSRECMRAARHGRPLALALLDIDDFKRINDSFSHASGDAVLVAVARCLDATRRGSDMVARLGGEEMVVVFPETSLQDAHRACELIRASLAGFDWAGLGLGAGSKVSASIGLTVYQENDTPHTLLHRADQAMYVAKREGKNRVHVDEDGRSSGQRCRHE